MISSAVTGVEISCSMVPRSHSRAMVSDVRKAPMTDITSASTPGTMKALLSRSSLNQVRTSTESGTGCGGSPRRCRHSTCRSDGVALQHALRVSDCQVRRVVIAGVNQGLDLHRSAVMQPLRKVVRNDDRQRRLAAIDGTREFGIRSGHSSDREIVAGLEPLQQVLAVLAAVAIEDIDRQMLQIEVHAVAKQQAPG